MSVVNRSGSLSFVPNASIAGVVLVASTAEMHVLKIVLVNISQIASSNPTPAR